MTEREHEMDGSEQFKQELQRALQSVRVPAGFADRVVSRAVREGLAAPEPASIRPGRGQVLRWPRAALSGARWWVGPALAAALLVGTGGELAYRHHQRVQAEKQFQLAARVTERALQQTRDQLSRAGFRLVD